MGHCSNSLDGGNVTPFERQRCADQLRLMKTGALREMTEMLDRNDKVERETLGMAINELLRRGISLEGVQLGSESIPPAQTRGKTSLSERVDVGFRGRA
jgi:hypothetical protein